jgi:hypothetical protein
MAKLAETNYDKVSQEIEELIVPIRANTSQFAPEQFNLIKGSLDPIKKLLPGPLPATTTIDKMWIYRRELDTTISSIRKTGTATEKASLPGLLNARTALTKDMTTSSEAIGLGKEFTAANLKYKDEFLPFNSYKTKSGMPEFNLNQAMKTLNASFKARNPDFVKISNIVKTLGPDGGDLVGQATLESAIRRSLNDKGLITPTALFSKIRELEASGVTNTQWGAKAKQGLVGIKRVLDGAGESLKTGGIQDAVSEGIKQASILRSLPSFIASRPGVALLQMIGSSKTPQTMVRKLVTDVISGITAMTAAKSNAKQ